MKLNDIPASPVCGRPKSICDKQRRQDIIGHAYRAFIELGFAQSALQKLLAAPRYLNVLFMKLSVIKKHYLLQRLVKIVICWLIFRGHRMSRAL